MSGYFFTLDGKQMPIAKAGPGQILVDKTWLLYQFPERRKEIAGLTYDQKMEWYQTRNAQEMVFLGNDASFQRFWYWNVVLPVKIKRLYYRIKNGEIFKHYKHISDTKKKILR
jgi:hypothetical protein